MVHSLYKKWNGKFFDQVSLQDLGQRYQLGHGGRECPCPKPGPPNFVVFHSTGVFRVNVDFCDCIDPLAPSRRVQLIRAGWFPASYERPQTVLTFDVLNSFHQLNLQGKTTLYDYYHSLVHLSDNLQLTTTVVNHKIIINSC